jgi:hypothetical protein
MGYVFNWSSIKMMRFQKAVVAIVMLVAQPQWAAAQVFTKDDIPLMIETSRTNEIRFERDYKGKPFSDVLPFRRALEDFFVKGEYTVSFGTLPFRGGVECSISHPKVLNAVVEWRPGVLVSVRGIVRTTMMGDLVLDNCQFTPQGTVVGGLM